MYTFDELINIAVSKNASDLHLTVGVPPTARIDGALHHITDQRCMPADVEAIAMSIMDDMHKETLLKCGEVDFAYSVPGKGRYRINVFRQRGVLAIAVRVLNLRIPSPEELGIPEAVVKMCEKKRGLVLVTGPTGSGKSTTLASLINIINRTTNQQKVPRAPQRSRTCSVHDHIPCVHLPADLPFVLRNPEHLRRKYGELPCG